ncbi:hypothetical protein, partial [Pseudonocardia pini]|uniref:hypothetical protein n=1 Tax=Pseudonocardia pini TaxID=2758030 RepID=UPI0015F0C716
MRGYRVGEDRLWRIWSEHAHDRVPPTELYEVLRLSWEHLSEFVDKACEVIADEYEALVRAERPAAGPGTPRHELIGACGHVVGLAQLAHHSVRDGAGPAGRDPGHRRRRRDGGAGRRSRR